MDLVGIGFVLLFAVLGAIIAYGGDVLGRNIGKKRRTLWRLRPRHTAALMTAAAGFMIPILTVVVVAALSQDVRQWLTEGRRAIEERNRLLVEVGQTRDELKGLSAQRDDQQRRLTSLQSNIQQREAENKKLTAQAQEARAELGKIQGDLANVRSQLREVGERYRTLQGANRSLTAENERLAGTNLAYGRQNAELGEQNLRLDSQLRTAQTDLETRRSQIKDLSDRIAKSQEDLKRIGEAYDRALEQFNAEAKRLRDDLDRQRNEFEREKLLAESEVARLQLLQRELSQGLDQNLRITRTLGLSFAAGDEIVRAPVAPGQTEETVRGTLTGLMRTARNEVQARVGPNAPDPAAGLIDVPLEGERRLTVAEQIDAAVRQLAGQREDRAVIAYAFWNTFGSEFVPIRLAVFDNPIVFQPMQVIAETRISGAQTDEQILNQLSRFLREDLRNAAVERNMIPAAGREEQLGSISIGTILEVMAAIRDAQRTVRVQAVAAGVTRAADPLKVELKLR